MTEADLKTFLDENKADITAAVRKATIDRLLESYRWPISDMVTKVVVKFVEEEVVPDIQAHLADQKGALIEAAIKSISGIGDDLAKALASDAAKNIATEYQRRDIVRAIFGVR